MQVRALFSMVDDFEMTANGVSSQSKLLYLSNAQAKALDLNDMDAFLSAMEIPKPQLIINLHPSQAFRMGATYQVPPLLYLHRSVTWKVQEHHWRVQEQWCTTRGHKLGDEYYQIYEASIEAMHDTDRRIASFLKDCIIPLGLAIHPASCKRPLCVQPPRHKRS